MDKLILIDGNSLLNRAFYATPVFTTKNGTPTNGVFGFIKLMMKIISEKKPTHFAVAFDLHAPTFRHKMYDSYKAGRKPMPEDLAVQMPILKDVLRLMKVAICELEGYEADDIIGTLAKRFSIQTYIYTGDRDSYQLVDETTNVCYTRKGVSDILELSVENFKSEIGLIPSQIIDLKALMGDKSDNIPGVAGVGEKSAYSLLERFNDIEGVYAHIDEITGALHKKLSDNREAAYFSYKLATIETNAPVECSLEDTILKMPFPYSVREKFAELEFKSLMAMDIFSNSEEEEDNQEGKEVKIEQVSVYNYVDLESWLEKMRSSKIASFAFHSTLTDVYVFPIENEKVFEQKEYRFPFTTGLLEPGFYDYQLLPLYEYVFAADKKVFAYNTKELRRQLKEVNVSFDATFEDVSILKCLSDGTVNGDDLDYCLNYFSLPFEKKAYGAFELYNIYFSKLNEKEKSLYKNVELPLSIVLFEMEQEGICMDEAYLKALSERYCGELTELTKKIHDLAKEKFNINSTQQLGRILFEKLRIGNGTVKKKSTNHYKTSSAELIKFVDEHEIINLLLRYRKIQKLNSTYVEGIKPFIRKNGKVYTTFNQINTSTGRLSSSNPNMQSIPVRNDEGRELRKLFLASPGNVLVDADYSQIELRLLAHFSGCKELIDAFNDGEDIHALTASQVFNVPFEKVTKDMRREAKAVNFGIIYGISAFGLSEDLGISQAKAQEYIDKYFERYSTIKAYIDESVVLAKERGYTTTLLGRRRVINELRSNNYNLRTAGERAAMNMPLQGSSADIIKLAMLGVRNRLKKENYKAKLIMQVHDELIIDCPESEKDAVAAILKEEMENAIKLSIPLDVEVGIGKNWFDAK